MELKGKWVAITGASAGIGKALSFEFHSRGANVLIIARRLERLQEIADELNSRREGSAEYCAADLTKDSSDNGLAGLDELIALLKVREIDILVNNAGRGTFGRFDELPLEGELSMIDLNVTAGVKLAHAIIPQLKRKNTGGIITISSIGGFHALPYMAVYSGTKAFNFFHSLSLREELKPFKVRVLSVCPGPVKTEFGEVANVPEMDKGPGDTAEAVAKDIVKAFLRNRSWIITAFYSKLISIPVRVLPRSLTLPLIGKIQGRGIR